MTATGQGMWLEHVGVVVRDLDDALTRWKAMLGLDPAQVTTSRVRDPETGETIDVGFLRLGPNRIELICPPEGSTSRFAAHLEQWGESLFHVSFYTDDLAGAAARSEELAGPLEVLTVRMTEPAAAGATVPTGQTRVVDIAWVPEGVTHGINVELVDAHPRTEPEPPPS
jgi:catechol 2,3-dioxygenase-like lactoylglutathione lyase family enzyme